MKILNIITILFLISVSGITQTSNNLNKVTGIWYPTENITDVFPSYSIEISKIPKQEDDTSYTSYYIEYYDMNTPDEHLHLSCSEYPLEVCLYNKDRFFFIRNLCLTEFFSFELEASIPFDFTSKVTWKYKVEGDSSLNVITQKYYKERYHSNNK